MIEQVGLLKNIGQFDSVSSGQKLPFSKFTFIYAENARGKTTMASIFRSLSTNNSILVTERHRLGSTDIPHVVIKARNQTFIFKDGVWSNQLSDIAVFDDNFIAENVCSGIEIEAGHKQKLHELILGEQGIELNRTLQTQISKIEDHNRNLREKESAIPASIRGNLSLDAFCALPANNKLDAEIQATERDIAAANSANSIKQQTNFLPLTLPVFDINKIEALLQSDLPSLQTETASKVRAHLYKLGNNAEKWIREGMHKIVPSSISVKDETCPFCDQNLLNSNIIAHYESYFSEAYEAHQQKINDFKKEIIDAHDAEIQSAFERSIRIAIQSTEFWRQFIEVPKIEIDTAEIARAWKAAREPVLAVLQAKLTAPLEKMNLSSEILEAIDTYNKHITTIKALSENLLKCNEQISLIKERVATADINILSTDLIKLKATQARYSSEYNSLCQDYINEKNAKKTTEKLRDDNRKKLEQYRADIFSKYESAINSYLGKFNAGFRLSSVNSQNTRGGSSCNYNVLINNIEVPITAETGPSFKNTLSAGDRNTLALAFFFTSLDQDKNLKNKIVIIDDPMTSLDEHRTLSTIHEMNDLAKKVNQIIVMSHSKPFLCQLWDGADKTNRSAVKIIRKGQSSILDTWDVTQDCITENDKRHNLIQQFITESTPQEREVAASLRHVLEAFLRVAYPIHFPPGTLLGKFHSKCTQALETKNLILNDTDTKELRKLMDYANKFHHDTNLAYETVSINNTELLDYCKRTLKFIQKG